MVCERLGRGEWALMRTTRATPGDVDGNGENHNADYASAHGDYDCCCCSERHRAGNKRMWVTEGKTRVGGMKAEVGYIIRG